MKIKSEIIFLILGFVLVGIFVYSNKLFEGFGTLPAANQSSSIPADQPGATSTDPSTSKPQPKDIEATIDVLKTFKELIDQVDPESTNMSPAQKSDLMNFKNNYDMIKNMLLAALANPDNTLLTLKAVTDMRNELQKGVDALKSANITSPNAGSRIQPPAGIPKPNSAPSMAEQRNIGYARLISQEPQPTTVAPAPGKVTMIDLQNLRMRVDDEKLRLANLRSSSASVTARISQLEKLSADLGDMITSIDRKVMKIEDVPITADAAEAFLKELKGNTGPIPPLIVPGGSVPESITSSPDISQFEGVPTDMQAVEKMLSAAKNLKWSMEVRLEHDPALEHKEKIMERLEKITKNLTKVQISQSPLPPREYDSCLKEIKEIQKHLEKRPPTAGPGYEGSMTRLPIDYSRVPSVAPMPEQAQVYAAQGAGCGPQERFPDGEISSDVYIRPGFPMNDEQIARRASASAFDESAVGGPDYKQKALDLCRQIKSAQLGDPRSFGCIENPDTVGPNYSWKGNHSMVCNRLGDSWGRSYPQQFGCPPYDPTAKFSYGL